MFRVVLALAIVCAACSGSKPTCQQVADRMLGLASEQVPGQQIVTMAHHEIRDTCQRDDWSGDARSCLINAKTMDDLEGCHSVLDNEAIALAQRPVTQTRQLVQKEQEEMRSGLKVNLPRSATGEIDPAKASLVIDVVGESIFVSGRQMGEAELANVFRAAFMRDKNVQVIIRAAKDVQHGRVVRLMDSAKAAGLTRLAIATTPE